MSGRHTGGTNGRLRISALPRTLKLIFKLVPRQLNDEIALAKIEIKRKGIQLGVAAAFFAVALVFVAFLVTGLIVAAIMGLATIMPAWLAALLVCGVFLVIALIVALVGYRKFKKVMPLVPEDTLRGLKYDLGIAKEGSAFDPAVLDPDSAQYKAAKAAKAEAAAKAKAEKAAKAAAEPEFGPPPVNRTPAPPGFSAAPTSPGSAMSSTRSSTSSPRPRPCWPPPRSACRTARSSSAAKSPASAGTAASKARSVNTASPAGIAEKLEPALETARRATASTAALVYLLRKLVKG